MKFQINFRFVDSNTELLPKLQEFYTFTIKNYEHNNNYELFLIMMSEMYTYTKTHQFSIFSDYLDNANILFVDDPCVLIQRMCIKHVSKYFLAWNTSRKLDI